MTAKHWLRLILLGATTGSGWAAPTVWAQAPPAPARGQDVEQQQQAILNSPSAPRRERDEAARRLVQSESWNILLDTIRTGPIEAQISVSRALAETQKAPTDFIDPLGRLLANTDAAAYALVNYRDNAQAIGWLRSFVLRADMSTQARAAAVRAMGSLNDKETAAFLIQELNRSNAPAGISDAAADALAEMTGHKEFGSDVSQWNEWWNRQRDKNPAQFRDERRAEREAEERQTRLQLEQLAPAINSLVAEGHRALPEDQREAYILRRLKDPQPLIRAAGAQLVTSKKENNEIITPAIVEQLRTMVGDSSADVRRSVAIAVKAINDPGAVPAILAQLSRERIPAIKAGLIEALIPTKDVSAAPELLKLIRPGPNQEGFAEPYQVVNAAAKALAGIGAEIAKDPQLSRKASLEISRAMERTVQRGRPLSGATLLRENLADALVPLHDPDLIQFLFTLLPEREEVNTPKVRIAAIRALAATPTRRQADVAQNIANSLLSDSDRGVRLKAAEALGLIGSPAVANALLAAMDPAREADELVRAAAWTSLTSLLPQFDINGLTNLKAHALMKDSADRKITINLVLIDKILEGMNQKPPTAKALDLAIVQEETGFLYLEKLGKPEESIPYFRAALDYWDSQRKEAAALGPINELQGLRLRAYLKAKQYKEAAQFADERIRIGGQPNAEVMGQGIVAEVRLLIEAKRLQDALQLLEESKKIEIPGRYGSTIDQLQKDIRNQIRNFFQELRPWYRPHGIA